MSNAEIIFIGGLLVLAIATVIYIVDRMKGGWIIKEKTGKSVEMEEGNGRFRMPKELVLFDENGNRLYCPYTRKGDNGKRVLINKEGNPVREIDPKKGLWFLNHDNVFDGNYNELKFQIANTKSHAARLEDELYINQLADIAKDEELIDRSVSHHNVRLRDKTHVNKEWHAEYRGRRYMQRQKKKGGSSTENVPVDEGDGEE